MAIHLHISKKSSNFAAIMKKTGIIIFLMAAMVGCNKPSRVEQYKQEKHLRDSVALVEQQRTLEYYQNQWEALMPQVDSLLPLFKYEKNEKYQDLGYYIVKPSALPAHWTELRVMVREDGGEMLVYKDGKRLSEQRVNELILKNDPAVARGQHLQIVVSDVHELEKRIKKTSLEVEKYQKRLERN